MQKRIEKFLEAAGFQVVEGSDKDMVVMTPKEEHSKGSHTVSIQSDTLEALRTDYETLRRFVVGLAEGNYGPGILARQAATALQACSVTYLPPGHPDRSH